MTTEPPFPYYEDLMIEDPDQPGHYIANPRYKEELEAWQKWAWNVDMKERLKELDQKIDAFLKERE